METTTATETTPETTPDNLQSRGEELFNVITHGGGAALGVVGLVLLVLRASSAGDTVQLVAATVYGVTLVLLYLASTLYHALPRGKAKRVFRRFDHIGIYLLIAGTYTVISLTALRESVGWGLFGVEWGLAAAGISLKAVFGPKYNMLSTLGYVVMGWAVLAVLGEVVDTLDAGTLGWLMAGGAFYTLGVPFYLLDQKKRYFHGVWHLFVLAGSVCHFVMAYIYLVR